MLLDEPMEGAVGYEDSMEVTQVVAEGKQGAQCHEGDDGYDLARPHLCLLSSILTCRRRVRQICRSTAGGTTYSHLSAWSSDRPSLTLAHHCAWIDEAHAIRCRILASVQSSGPQQHTGANVSTTGRFIRK